MKVQGNSIQSIAKKFWRFVEVYIFVMMSTVSGSAITKDVVFAKSKAKDKTLQTGIELFTTCYSAPPHAANTPNLEYEDQVESATCGRVVAQRTFKTSLSAIEKGCVIEEKEHFTYAAWVFETRMSAFWHQYVFQEHVRHHLPLNLATENIPLLI